MSEEVKKEMEWLINHDNREKINTSGIKIFFLLIPLGCLFRL